MAGIRLIGECKRAARGCQSPIAAPIAALITVSATAPVAAPVMVAVETLIRKRMRRVVHTDSSTGPGNRILGCHQGLKPGPDSGMESIPAGKTRRPHG